MWEKAQYREMGSSAGFKKKERLTGSRFVGGRALGEKEARMRGMGRAGGRGLKDGRRPNFRAGAGWQGW